MCSRQLVSCSDSSILCIIGSAIDNDVEFATLKDRGLSLSLASLYSGIVTCLPRAKCRQVVSF